MSVKLGLNFWNIKTVASVLLVRSKGISGIH
jgi:hypothetical protein